MVSKKNVENNKENLFYVYKHTFPNSKVYIGITSQKPYERWGKDGNGYKTQDVIYRAIKKYGWDNITHEVLYEGLSQIEAETKEKELINQYNSSNPKYGYNLDLGGNHQGKTSELTKKKLGELNKGRLSPVAKRIVMLDDNNQPIEYFDTILEADTKTGIDGSTISSVCRGKRYKAGGKKFCYIDDLSTPISRKNLVVGSIPYNAKKVKQIDPYTKKVIAIYDSSREASKVLDGIAEPNNIRACCNGLRKTCGGFIWKYVDEQIKNTHLDSKSPFNFKMIGLKHGDVIKSLEYPEIECSVCGDSKHIEYNGKIYSLSSLAKVILGRKRTPNGTKHFTYNGEILDDILKRMEK